MVRRVVFAGALLGALSTFGATIYGDRVDVNVNRLGEGERQFADVPVPDDFTLSVRKTAHCSLAKATLADAVEPRFQIDYAYGFGSDAVVTVRVKDWTTVEGEIKAKDGTHYFTSVFSTFPARYGTFDGPKNPFPFTRHIRGTGCVGYFHENYYSKPGDTMQVRTGFSRRSVAEAAAFLASEMPSFDAPVTPIVGKNPPAGAPLPVRKFVTDNPTAAYIQRTMKKLEASTAEHPATVRILFYGQSVTFQPWSAKLAEELRRRYPTVNFIFRNEAIGGYGTDALVRCMEKDVFPFYPDLMFFHDYGDVPNGYHAILDEVRKRTTAEIVLWSSHLRKEQKTADIRNPKPGDSAVQRTTDIRAVTTDLKTMYIDLQRKWCDALDANGWGPTNLIRDTVHLNPLGVEYYRAFIGDELVRRPELDGQCSAGTIAERPFAERIAFTGNRVVAVSDGTGDPDASAEIWLDGKKIRDAATKEMWAMTRPSALLRWFPGLKAASFETVPTDEFWTLTFLPGDPTDAEYTLPEWTRRRKPPKMKPLRYRVDGSVTGFDGEGRSDENFLSQSGRVKIPPVSFEDYFAYPKLRPTAGQRIVWRTYPLFADEYRPQPKFAETVLVQGCANTKHVLEFRNVKGTLGIGSLVVNTPPTEGFVTRARKTTHVALPGDDLVALRDRIRFMRKPGEKVEVILEDGVYEVTKQITLDSPKDSNAVWRARNPGKAVIVGGPAFRGCDFAVVTNAAILARIPEAARGKAVGIRVPDSIVPNFHKGAMGPSVGARNARLFRIENEKDPSPLALPVLTVDGKFMMPAAWPNGENFLWTDKQKQTGREAKWNWTDADVYSWGFHGRAFDYRTQRVSVGWNAASNRVDFGAQKVGDTARYRFLNVLEELDLPGEWCYHAPTKTAVLYPPEGFAKDSLVVFGTHRPHFFAVRADAVSLKGLAFTSKSGFQAVAFDSCRGSGLRGCRFSGMDAQAVYLEGAQNEVRSCDFEDVASSAIHVRGGDVKTRAMASNVVENCRMRHMNFLESGMFPATIRMYGCGHFIRHNDIADTMEQAVGFHSFASVVEYNRFRDCNKEYGDSNVIGTGGLSAYGSVIRYNDVGGSPGYCEGIYVDDCAQGVSVYGNVIHDCGHYGIFLGGGRANVVSNNVVVGGWGGVYTDNRGLTWPAWQDPKKATDGWIREFDFLEGPIAKVYPKWAADYRKEMARENGKWYFSPVECTFVNNLFYDIRGYGSSMQLSKGLFPPDGTNVFTGNLVVRPVGLPKGWNDIQSGERTHAQSNAMAEKSKTIYRPIGPLRILDGTPEEPIDIGFVHIPANTVDPRCYVMEWQGWVGVNQLVWWRSRTDFKHQDDTGDYRLKPDARIFKEIPGFQPIPWEKIGNYQDEWRSDVLVASEGQRSEVRGQRSNSGEATSSSLPKWAADFSLVNIFPYSPGREEQVARDMEAYVARSGESLVLYSMSFHPEGKPAQEKADRLLESYRKVRAGLGGGKDVQLGVLVQSVLGHWPRHDENSESWECTQNLSGKTPRFCPDDPGFRDYTTYFVTALAKEKPAFVLGDDDIHFTDECFCRHHVAKFNALMGTAYDSDGLRAAVLASKTGDKTWTTFFRLQRESMTGLCAHIRAAIDAVDPTIPAGMCMSGSEYRFVGDLAKAIAAKGQRPWFRIANTGNYEEYAGLDFSGFSTRSLLFASVYPDCDLFDESDTFPHNLWNRSASAMTAKLATAQMAGLGGGLTWYVGGHKGRLAIADEYLRAVARRRGFRKAFAKAIAGSELEGFAVLASTNFPSWHVKKTAENPNAREDFVATANWGRNFGGMFGVPYRVTTDANETNAVYTLAGRRVVERLSEAELRAVFSARVLLDGDAALAVADRGHADWLGVTPSRKKVVCTRESLADGSLTLSFVPNAPKTETPFFESQVAGMKIVSWLEYSPYEGSKDVRRVAPGAVSFVNALGGRIVSVAYPVNLDVTPSQSAYWSHTLHFDRFSEARKRWFERVLSEAYGAALPVVSADDRDIYLLARKAKDGARILLLVNQNRDVLEGVNLRFAERPAGIERLTSDGRWLSVPSSEADGVTHLDLNLACYEPLVLRTWAEK